MTFYVTTPIYYVNDTPHIGHAYTTIVADVLNRYRKLFGEKTFFLTGTDEHGQKVQQAAERRGVAPQAHCDEMVVRFQEIWRELDVEHDIFMRTTFPYHKKVVQDCLQFLFEKGEIYPHEYEGWYSVSEEIFYTEKDLVDGKSPMGKEVTKIVEKNYFFRMSKYQERLVQYIEEHPAFIQPEGKRSEVLGFLRQPLQDLCISRPKARLSWGVELPFDADYVTYVWFDALLNYASAIGYRQGADRERQFHDLWTHATHLIGKDILITHAVYWPTMLMALETPLPRQIFAHGWWLNELGGKMSKSEGPTVNPLDYKDLVGVDPFRYFLCRDITLGSDAAFSHEGVVTRVNSELSNNLGNLASRVLGLVEKFFDGKAPPLTEHLEPTPALKQIALGVAERVKGRIEGNELHLAIGEVVDLLSATNRYVDSCAPWKTAKEDLSAAGECLAVCLEVLRISALLLSPVMPSKMSALLTHIGWDGAILFSDASQWGLLRAGTPVSKGEGLFPRIEKGDAQSKTGKR